MTPFYTDAWMTVYAGDNRQVLKALADQSVHCVITSPPYWSLRDYGTATWEGGDPACDHKKPNADTGHITHSTLGGGKATNAAQVGGYRSTCGKCGATRQDAQLGLEPTPEQYVENMVAVFREVRRVLRSDGTLWLNLGDSYAGGGQTGRNDGGRPEKGKGWAEYDIKRTKVRRDDGLKPKDLVGIPWRVAFALQADGWYLRSDIIWSKPNPMPESVTDRPTKAHEYLFLLAKSERYYFDADAVREGFADERMGASGARSLNYSEGSGRNDTLGGDGKRGLGVSPAAAGRNIRSVWTIATQPYPGAHFATFPPKLVEPCILAGSPPGGVVLDPFGGSGTTAMVAQHLSRRAVLIDLNPDYIDQQLKRNQAMPLGLEAA